MPEGKVIIKPGREKPIRQQHPWIYSGAIARAESAVDGELVTVLDHKQRILARGYWNSKSQIQVRIMTWSDEPIDEGWWRRKLSRAAGLRSIYFRDAADTHEIAYRAINAENDFIPGLVIDRYGDWWVLQAQTRFIDRHKGNIVRLLEEEFAAAHVYERSDIDSRRLEGIPSATGVLLGGPAPEAVVVAEEVNFFVDIKRGHKTGFYLDQRLNRQILSELVTEELAYFDRRLKLLNLFSYSGGFAMSAFKSLPMHIVNVDSSRAVLELAERNFTLNGFNTRANISEPEFIQADAFEYLHYCLAEGQRFDIVVIDPPKFAQHKRHVQRAARGYKDLNLNAFKLVSDGGYLMTFSCSGAVSRDLFQKIVFSALADSGRQAQIISHLSAAPDHPVALTFPEGEYLTGLLLRVF